MTRFEFYLPNEKINRDYDNKNLKKNFHNLLIYFNPNLYFLNKDYAKSNYDEILNLYNLFSSNPLTFDKNLILNKVSKICNSVNLPLDNENFNSYSITLEELYKNSVTIKETCKRCMGIGFNNIKICTKCEGSKLLELIILNDYNVKIRRIPCDECDRKGWIGFGVNCVDCNGLKYLPKTLQPLIEDITISDQILKIKIDPEKDEYYSFYIQSNPFFSKRGKDLFYTMDIHLSDLVNGFQVKINLLNRNYIILKSKEMLITNPNLEYTIPNLGFIHKKGVGNLVVKLNVIYPKTLQEFHFRQSDTHRYILSERDKFIDVYEI